MKFFACCVVLEIKLACAAAAPTCGALGEARAAARNAGSERRKAVSCMVTEMLTAVVTAYRRVKRSGEAQHIREGEGSRRGGELT